MFYLNGPTVSVYNSGIRILYCVHLYIYIQRRYICKITEYYNVQLHTAGTGT